MGRVLDPLGWVLGAIGRYVGPIFAFSFVFMCQFMSIFIGPDGEGIGSNREVLDALGRRLIHYLY